MVLERHDTSMKGQDLEVGDIKLLQSDSSDYTYDPGYYRYVFLVTTKWLFIHMKWLQSQKTLCIKLLQNSVFLLRNGSPRWPFLDLSITYPPSCVSGGSHEPSRRKNWTLRCEYHGVLRTLLTLEISPWRTLLLPQDSMRVPKRPSQMINSLMISSIPGEIMIGVGV